MLDILFRAVSATLKEFAQNPTRYKEGGKIGFTEMSKNSGAEHHT